jgi:hypothetical protein
MGRVAKTFGVLGFTVAVAAGAYGDIVASFPAPCADAVGLGWDGNYLWCLKYEPDYVYRLDPRNGSVVFSFRVGVYPPMFEPTGLTCAEGYVVSGHDMPNAFYVSTYTGSRVRYISEISEYGYTLTWDGQYFWGKQDWAFLTKYSRDGEIVASFPGFGINSLGWDGEYLIAGTDYSLMKLTTTGSCVATMRSPWSSGCACGNGYIWVLEPTLDYIYKLYPSFKPTGAAPGSFGKIKALFR